MLLNEWLNETGRDPNEIAELAGISQSGFSRIRSGQRIPRPEAMARIFEVTEGRVQPNDFYAAYIRRFRNLLLISASPAAMAVAGIPTEKRPPAYDNPLARAARPKRRRATAGAAQ